MPSPLAHVGVAVAFCAPLWPTTPNESRPARVQRWLFTGRVIFATLTPDLDVLPMLWDPQGIASHRGPTHSILGAALIGILSGIGAELSIKQRLTLILSALLHLPLDWSTGEPGAPLKYGAPLLWPLSSQRWLDPAPWFGAYAIDQPGGLRHMFTGPALWMYGKELLTGGACFVLRAGFRAIRSRSL